MSTALAELRTWFEDAESSGASHMIIVCDTYDWEDYPVFVSPGDDPVEVATEFNGKDMQKIMECYKISLGWDSQSKEYRSNHWEMD